ncbi:L-lactate dehydrogenase complex protein LldG [Sporosarcina luteola]|nr:L-lactate dehydrogenase complex protein LldG [Sporosarcina luteola]
MSKGTVTNDKAFLQQIGQRLGRSEIRTAPPSRNWNFQPQHNVLKDKTADELVQVLELQCQNIHTRCIRTTTPYLESTIQQLIQEYGGKSVVYGKDSRFEEYGLTTLLRETLSQDDIESYEWDDKDQHAAIEQAETANIGIAISDMTLAESGTVVLYSDQHKGRTIQFLPMQSFFIIPKSTIVPRMTQAAMKMRERFSESVPSCVNFITGPSNSADIELNLVIGVHGPVRAVYIVVDDI